MFQNKKEIMVERERYIELLYIKNYEKKYRPGKSSWGKCGLKKTRS